MSVAVQAMRQSATGPAIQDHSSSYIAMGHRKQSNDQPKSYEARRPLPTVPSVRRNARPISSTPQMRSVRASFVSSARSTGLATACANTQVLARLLNFLSWKDFHSLSCTSRSIRRIFLDANVKDAVFSRFIPGYRKALRTRDLRLWEGDIRMDYNDLSLLLASLDAPLHQYPMHALSVLSSDLPTWEQMQTTKRLQAFTEVHSRSVLLLQNLVHSSARPCPSDLDPPLLKASDSPTRAGSRELTFPAPLSYPDLDSLKGNTEPTKSRSPSDCGGTASQSSSSSLRMQSSKTRKQHSKKWGPGNGPPSEVETRIKRDRSSSRFFIFGGRTSCSPLPQRAMEPEALRYYSGSWRSSYYASPPSEDGILKPPKRRFVSSRLSSASSLGSSPSPSSSGQAATPTSSSSPHDLYAATKRNRAPILRVFVPCMELTDESITACEDQLIDDGLWDHMSVGDVVCNLGYVPLAEDTDEPGQETDHRRWLVFTGDQLEIYHPARPPPINGALSLPSPFYYCHILPSFVNPRLRLILPSFPAHYSLAPLTTTVASPHATGGYARVKTFAWLASLDAHVTPGSPMSSGWLGEWVLQGEGTPEGKIALQDALRGGQETEHEYEIVLDKSGEGRLWLRMIAPVRTQLETDSRTLSSS